MNEKIMKLAEKYHAGQFRKGEAHLPYIVHPRAVVEMLLAWGEPETSPAVAAAWGHDLLEDTKVDAAEIREAAGDRVLAVIEALTCRDDSRKQEYLLNVAASGDRDVLLVKLADRICNSRDYLNGGQVDYAAVYFHRADCVHAAVSALPPDPVVCAALAEWQKLECELADK